MKAKNSRTKRMTVLLVVLSIFILPVLARAEAEAPTADKVAGEFATGVMSAYIWRGQELTRHSVVVQPSMTISYRGFSANLWGNLDTKPYSAGDEEFSSNFTETDVTLSYSHTFGMVTAGVGYIYYALAAATPGGTDLPDSQEVFATLGLNTVLTPTLTVYKEIDHYHQWYATLGVSHTFSLHEKVGLKLAASVSYLLSTDAQTYPKFDSNLAATDKKFNNFHDGIVSLAIPIYATEHVTLTPTVSYVFPLSDDARYEMKARSLKGTVDASEKDSAFLYGGVVLSFAF